MTFSFCVFKVIVRQPGAFFSLSVASLIIVTCDLGLEGASHNMVRSTVFD